MNINIVIYFSISLILFITGLFLNKKYKYIVRSGDTIYIRKSGEECENINLIVAYILLSIMWPIAILIFLSVCMFNAIEKYFIPEK